MSVEDNTQSETHRIEGTDNLLMQTIKDQASDLEHSWREAIQNGLDSPTSTRVNLEYDNDYTIVSDNGDGVDLDKGYGIDLLTNLGESSKESEDDETIGQFGIGKGQIIAKGRTVMASGETALLFDVENFGLEVVSTPISQVVETVAEYNQDWADTVDDAIEGDTVEGVTIVMHHYTDQVPDYSFKWEEFQERIEHRFKYAELATATRIYVNDERISDGSVNVSEHSRTHVEEFTGEHVERAHIGVKHGSVDSLEVYSNGVYITDIESRGLAGTIVVEGNLDLNFARNEIKSGCKKFAEISERLDEIRADLFESVSRDLNQEAREFIVYRMLEHGEKDRFSDTELFKTVSEGYVSLDEINRRNQIGRSSPGDRASEKLAESLGMLILVDSDSATERILNTIDTDEVPGGEAEDDDDGETETEEPLVSDSTEMFDPTEKAESMGMHTEYSKLNEDELQPKQREKLQIARELADQLGEEIGKDRDVYYGESDVANAWTDGYDEIVITDSATSSNSYVEYVPELFRIIVHEYAHTGSSKPNEANHGRRFRQNYRDNMDSHWDILTETLASIRANGVENVARGAPKY